MGRRKFLRCSPPWDVSRAQELGQRENDYLLPQSTVWEAFLSTIFCG